MATLKRKWIVSLSIVVFILPLAGSGYLTIGPGRDYVRAASLLQRIADGKGQGTLAHMDSYPVDEQATTVLAADGTGIPARLYIPQGVKDAPGMVLLHGVHHLGIEEPRLVAFSRAMSSAGIVVLTPELKEIADYHVSHASIATIGAAVKSLSAQLGGEKVGLMGLSFAGGLALMTAADPQYADSVGYVVSLGGHHDLARVCEFFANDTIAHPDGSIQSLKAHEYGALVVVYSHPEDFFSAQDMPIARESLRYQLWEDEAKSRAAAEKLSPAGHARMELLWLHKKDALATELAQSINKHREESGMVSPHGNLAGLRAPVLLMHGAGDTVIPASETLWLEKEVPARWMRAALVTPLLSHVDVGGAVSMGDKLAIVSFIAELLRASDACRTARQATSIRLREERTNARTGVRLGYAG